MLCVLYILCARIPLKIQCTTQVLDIFITVSLLFSQTRKLVNLLCGFNAKNSNREEALQYIYTFTSFTCVNACRSCFDLYGQQMLELEAPAKKSRFFIAMAYPRLHGLLFFPWPPCCGPAVSVRLVHLCRQCLWWVLDALLCVSARPALIMQPSHCWLKCEKCQKLLFLCVQNQPRRPVT